MANLRRRPWRGALLPPFLLSFARAARRAARDADLVHAHWLPAGAVAMATRKPFVVQLHGSDVVLARRAPWLARRVLCRAAVVVCVSTALGDEARGLGAAEVIVIPNGVEPPAEVGEEADPPEVLYAGRLSREKGVLELVQAAQGMNLVVVGDGPLRAQMPHARGFVPRDELARLYARAAVVACPSHREGFGVTCLEAMAHGRPVVAGAVGGLLDLVVDGETGILVPPGDVVALRAALERLLGDRELRRRLGAAGRRRASEQFSWDRITHETVELYARYAGREWRRRTCRSRRRSSS
jgi:glycosyltransferase involved in cell wall biosynthesis